MAGPLDFTELPYILVGQIGTEKITSLSWMIRNLGISAVRTENMSGRLSCLPSEFEPVRLYVPEIWGLVVKNKT